MPTGFVAWRDDNARVWLYSEPREARSTRVRDARWGDFLRIQEQRADGWTRIKWGTATYFLRSENVTGTRPLELIFVDVGQGDGCVVISPEAATGDGVADAQRERILVVDAGERNNMLAFLKWRFGKLKKRFDFHAAVVTHPDQDHYQGFQGIFSHANAFFDRVYHNGLLERTGDDLLGPSDATGRFLTDIAATDADVRRIYADAAVRGRKRYPKLIHTAMTSGRVGRIDMLSSGHGRIEGGRSYMPGFAPSSGRTMTIEVLGPVVEPDAQGQARLRWFGGAIGSAAHDDGKTKNGHSVILKLTHGAFRLLFGGDLNRPAEDFLLRHYGGIADGEPLSRAVAPARTRLACDVMKCCHHGASDVTDEFISAVMPFAYVVSSGDEESHAHPRPDLLGRLGKLGRTDAPLILCTELLRSTRESGKAADFRRLRALDQRIDDPATAEGDRKAARRERRDLQQRIRRRNVGVYGAVTIRTDGRRMEISFQLEKPRGKQRWHNYRYLEDPAHGWRALN